MDLIKQIVARAQANKQRIVLPEGTEERTIQAADRLIADGVADIILLGNPDEIMALARQYGLGNISRATLVDPKNHEKKALYAEMLWNLRKSKGMTLEQAIKLGEDP